MDFLEIRTAVEICQKLKIKKKCGFILIIVQFFLFRHKVIRDGEKTVNFFNILYTKLLHRFFLRILLLLLPKKCRNKKL
jgi:hypothetical protein